MGNKTPLNDAELDAFFAAAQEETVKPSEDFMARILADAMAEMPAPAQVVGQISGQISGTAVAKAPSFWAAILATIGGWPAAAGLATATVAGLMIGITTPDTLNDWTGGYLAFELGYQVEDFLPSYDDLLGEG